MKISYNWIKKYIPDLPEPEKVSEAIIFHAFEVEEVTQINADKKTDQHGLDTIFDIKTLPDRNHDCLSHQGMAREIAGILDLKFIDFTSLYKVPESKPTNLKIEIETSVCRRYMGRIVRNLKVGPSPEWVKNNLESIGQRSINNIVDVTNIVMYDCGQPCHIFDLDKLTDQDRSENGSTRIIIRNANEEEEITTLNNKQIKLTSNDAVISVGRVSHQSSSVSLAIAGVKGGKYAEVDENTTNILIEVANFDSYSVRKTAKRVGIFTDAVKRFENDLSPELCEFAMKEISGLLVEYGFNEFEDIVDIYLNKQKERKISFTTEFINKKLGSNISSDQVEEILKRYGYKNKREGEEFEIIVPVLRLDLNIPEDMIEEIGRVYGYEKIIPVIPKINFTPKINEIFYKTLAVRKKLTDEGYREVMTYAFTNKGDVEVLASASDKKFLRTNLSDGLKESIVLNQRNAPLLELDSIKVFEIGTVFKKEGEEICVAYGDKKGVEEMTLDKYSEKNKITHPSYLHLSVDQGMQGLFKMWSLYPFISRDISLWVSENTQSSEIVKIIKENGTELLIVDPRLVDKFKKEDKISYAFRLIFQSFDRTLTDEEVNKIMENISTEISKNVDWKIR